MRRLEVSTDPMMMLRAALNEAAGNAGVELSVEGSEVYLVR